MNLAGQYLKIHEGGLVKLPIELQKLVIGGAKEVIMGQVLDAFNTVIKQYSNLLNSLDKNHIDYSLFEDIIESLEKYVSTYSMYKPRKSNVKSKKILIKKSDMMPYAVEDDFTILLTTETSYKKGTQGSIKTLLGNSGFHSEIPLYINFGRVGGTLDTLKSLAYKAPTIHMMMRDNKPLDNMSKEMLNNVFPDFKAHVKNIQNSLDDAITMLKHELTHVVQFQTGIGYNHKDLKKEGGYTEYVKGKNANNYDEYSTGSKEVKAYLVNQVDSFYNKYKNTSNHNDSVKAFVADRVWFNAFKDEKKRNAVIRDFVIALEKDRRFNKNKIEGNMKLAEQLLKMHEETEIEVDTDNGQLLQVLKMYSKKLGAKSAVVKADKLEELVTKLINVMTEMPRGELEARKVLKSSVKSFNEDSDTVGLALDAVEFLEGEVGSYLKKKGVKFKLKKQPNFATRTNSAEFKLDNGDTLSVVVPTKISDVNKIKANVFIERGGDVLFKEESIIKNDYDVFSFNMKEVDTALEKSNNK